MKLVKRNNVCVETITTEKFLAHELNLEMEFGENKVPSTMDMNEDNKRCKCLSLHL